MKHTIRILLVDDHDLVRSAMKQILSTKADIKVVGEACSGSEALPLVLTLKPDVTVMDYRMPGMDGISAIQAILTRQPEAKILILSAIALDGFLLSLLLRQGIKGFLHKNSHAEEMLIAIRTVYQGEEYLSPKLIRQLDFKRSANPIPPFDVLSERELQVAILAIEGRTPQEIADRLSVKRKSVQTYLDRMFEKLCVNNKIELALLAGRHGVTAYLWD